MSNYSNETLTALLKDIRSDMKEGFNGIHERQDTTNGNVKENTAYRLKATGGFTVLKFILSFVGIGNIIILVKLFT